MGNGSGVPAEYGGWLEKFRRRHGRPLRILHIGNVANNAYNCSKILDQAGLWSDVICYDYYHIMSCPEWQESNYTGELGSEFYPAWEQVDLRGYQRPRWFAQGPVQTCVEYLIARCDGRPDADHWWQMLSQQRAQTCARLRGDEPLPAPPCQAPITAPAPAPALTSAPVHRLPRLRRLLGPAYLPLRAAAWQVLDGLCLLPRTTRRLLQQRRTRLREARYPRRVQDLCAAYARLFPQRAEPLRPAELNGYAGSYRMWKRLLRRYDLVFGYATDGIYPLLANTCPYFALEHGTIRNLPFQDTAQGKLCALTYRLAAEAFITNGDNMEAADRLGLANFRFLPHPLNEDLKPTIQPEVLREELRQKLDCDFLLFHPSRHHWAPERDPEWEKGNDILMQGFAAFLQQTCPRAGAVFVEWGQKVGASRALLERLGLTSRVLWIPPQPMPRMLDYIRASDVLADQFYLGAFGGITPRGLMLGCPTLLYLNEAQHHRCFPVLPPLINARTPEQVCAGLTRLYRDPRYAAGIKAEGMKWYQQYHSNQRVLSSLLEAIREARSRRTSARSAHPGLAAAVPSP